MMKKGETVRPIRLEEGGTLHNCIPKVVNVIICILSMYASRRLSDCISKIVKRDYLYQCLSL